MKSFFSVVAVVVVCGVALAAGEDTGKNDPLNAVVKIEATSTSPNYWLPWQNKIAQSNLV